MDFWDHIVNNAMVGTGKKLPAENDLPAGIATAGKMILKQSHLDQEEKFLQLAAIAMNYRQCGVSAIKKEQVDIPVCPGEESKYCSTSAMQALKNILAEESLPLLKLWLQLCCQQKEIVSPEIVPVLLAQASERKSLWEMVVNCTGKRGKWLMGFNEEWNKAVLNQGDDPWQTGTLDQRKLFFKQLRKNDPVLALEELELVWPSEDAATKLSFLEVMSDTIGEADINFLQSLSSEKSKRIKEQADQLLKQIPGSPIVICYGRLLAITVSLKKEKSILGLSSKIALQFLLPAEIENSIYASGIEKLSNSKEFTDDEFIIYQLVQSVPPSFWQVHLQETVPDIIAYFKKSEAGKKMLPALVMAVRKFKDANWAFFMMQYCDVFYIDLLPLLPVQQRVAYSIKYFEKYPESILGYALQAEGEWDLELAQKIFRFTAANPYQYNRAFYQEHIALIPGKIALGLEKFTPKEEHLQGNWSNISEHILKLLQLKSETIQSFH